MLVLQTLFLYWLWCVWSAEVLRGLPAFNIKFFCSLLSISVCFMRKHCAIAFVIPCFLMVSNGLFAEETVKPSVSTQTATETTPATAAEALQIAKSIQREPYTGDPGSSELVQEFKLRKAHRVLAVVEAGLAKHPTAVERKDLMLFQFSMYSTLGKLGDSASEGKAQSVLETLAADLDPEIAEVGKRYLLLMAMQSFDDWPVGQQNDFLTEVSEFVLKREPSKDNLSLVSSLNRPISTAKDNSHAATTMQQILEHLKTSDELKSDPRFSRIEGLIRRVSLPGGPIKLTGTTVGGESFDLASLKGKVVVVDFWATWCRPCVAEFPELKRLYELYHDRGFEVVAVSLDGDFERLEQFVVEQEIPWITLFEKSQLGGKGWDNPIVGHYGISSIPTTFLIGADGNVISTLISGDELEEELGKLFSTRE